MARSESHDAYVDLEQPKHTRVVLSRSMWILLGHDRNYPYGYAAVRGLWAHR